MNINKILNNICELCKFLFSAIPFGVEYVCMIFHRLKPVAIHVKPYRANADYAISNKRNIYMSKNKMIRNNTAEFLIFTSQAGEDNIEVRIEDEKWCYI